MFRVISYVLIGYVIGYVVVVLFWRVDWMAGYGNICNNVSYFVIFM